MNENYLLDTDILISYLRGYPDTIDLLKSLAQNGATFSISVITVVEIEAGIRAGEKAKTKELLASIASFWMHPWLIWLVHSCVNTVGKGFL